jgi:hypothetical protein
MSEWVTEVQPVGLRPALTNSVEHSPRKAISRSVGQGIIRFVWNFTDHFHAHRSLLLACNQSQISTFPTLVSDLF